MTMGAESKAFWKRHFKEIEKKYTENDCLIMCDNCRKCLHKQCTLDECDCGSELDVQK